MDESLIKEFEKKYALSTWDTPTKIDPTDLEYFRVVEGYPKHSPTPMDRELDLDVLLTRWIRGEWKEARVREQAKKRGFRLSFPRHNDEYTDWITIIDVLNGNKERRFYF